MGRCSQCGKANRDGSLFCQDCGHRMSGGAAAPAPATAAAPMSKEGSPLACTACGASNPAGMKFCRMCGASLAAAPAPTPAAAPPAPAKIPPAAAAAAPAKVPCAACGALTPTGFAFCQHCGVRLAAPPAAQARPVGATVLADAGAPMATPPAGLRKPATPVAGSAAFAPTVMPGPAAAQAAAPARAVDASRSQGLRIKAMPATGSQAIALARTDPAKAPPARFVAVRRDGTDGDVYGIEESSVDLGRTEGALTFPDDPYLAGRHARVEGREGKHHLLPLDRVNGVFLRLRGSTPLTDGDTLLVGKQVIRFELLAELERDPAPAVEHGVMVFGTPPRPAWARLRQLVTAGISRDVFHLSRAEVILGREEGDLIFPDDEFMSRRHARLVLDEGGVALVDLESSNGTYLKVRGEHELATGDLIRLGDQLLRFEIL